MSIYTELKEAGVPLSNHESDLYAKVTPESKVIVARYEHKGVVTTFVNQVEGGDGTSPNAAGSGDFLSPEQTGGLRSCGGLWYEIPFAFDPWWEVRACRDAK